jgi:diacylglycerol kinase (ATP)
MQFKRYTGFKRLIMATGYSLAGFRSAFAGEAAFRQELLLCVIMIPLGLWLGDNGIERALLVGCLLLVLIVELLNTAVESVVDRTGLELHVLAKRAKDIGSAAVFVALANVVVIWLLILWK